MPVETIQTKTIDFQWQYQDMRTTIAFVSIPSLQRSIRNDYSIQISLEQIRSNPVPNYARLDPGEDRSPALIPVSAIAIVEDFSISPPSRRQLPSYLRNVVHENLRREVLNNWVYQYATNYPRRQLANEWANRLGYRSSLYRALVDRVSMEIVTFTNELVQEYSCPDGDEDCVAIHFNEADHHTTDIGEHRVPQRVRNWIEYTDDHGNYMERSYWIHDPAFTVGGRAADFNRILAHLGLRTCSDCGDNFAEVSMTLEPATRSQLCPGCVGPMAPCGRCGVENLEDNLVEVEVYDDDEDEYMVLWACNTCARSLPREDRLNLQSYSFKPSPVFRHLDGGTETLFMGMELEVARTGSNVNTMQVNRWIRNLPDFLYVKSDSSVTYGMEVVTHPFTYEWAKEEFPYNLFENLLTIEGVVPDHGSAGTHIHLSKAAFDITHMWKFILFFLENKQFFGTLGDRGHAHSYGSFEGLAPMRENLLRIVKAKGNAASVGLSFGRGAINLAPEETIEMRFIAGNVQPHMIKKNQQLMKSAYDFTKLVKASDAMKGALGDPGYFLGYLEDTDFEELKAHVSKSFPIPKKLERSDA